MRRTGRNWHFESHEENINETIQSYTEEVETTDGSILFGVCRGRLSEGLDFKDRKGRLVIVVGIPFPSYLEPKIILKKYYLEQKRKAHGASYQDSSG